MNDGAWQFGCRRVAVRGRKGDGAWLLCSGACWSVERPEDAFHACIWTDLISGSSMYAKSKVSVKTKHKRDVQSFSESI